MTEIWRTFIDEYKGILSLIDLETILKAFYYYVSKGNKEECKKIFKEALKRR